MRLREHARAARAARAGRVGTGPAAPPALALHAAGRRTAAGARIQEGELSGTSQRAASAMNCEFKDRICDHFSAGVKTCGNLRIRLWVK